MKKYCVYAHYKLSNNEIFYIGKGISNKRPYEKSKRGLHWKNIVNKYGYYITIIANNLTNEEAIEIEKSQIEKYGRTDKNTGVLINKTDGGDGGPTRIGYKNSPETRKNIGISLKGRIFTTDHKSKMSESAKNRNPISEETRKKLSESAKNRNPISEETRKKLQREKTEEHKKNLSKARKNIKFTEEHKKKLRKPKTKEHKEKLSKAAKAREKSVWIFKENIGTKKIKIQDLNNYLDDEWTRGRKNTC